jgi:hypothetical protein
VNVSELLCALLAMDFQGVAWWMWWNFKGLLAKLLCGCFTGSLQSNFLLQHFLWGALYSFCLSKHGSKLGWITCTKFSVAMGFAGGPLQRKYEPEERYDPILKYVLHKRRHKLCVDVCHVSTCCLQVALGGFASNC